MKRINRRRTPRFPYPVPVRILGQAREQETMTSDVSQLGVFILTDDPVGLN